MYGLLWITIFITNKVVRRNDFYEWHSHEWKLFANHFTSDQNMLFMFSYIYVSLTRYSMLPRPKRNKNNDVTTW